MFLPSQATVIMKRILLLLALNFTNSAMATPHFVVSKPISAPTYQINGKALCATAKETLSYLNKGYSYDPQVIHGGRAFTQPLERVKATLVFICQHQNELNNPAFVQRHFDFIQWIPDHEGANRFKKSNALTANLPRDKLLMTKYYVHEASASVKPTSAYPFALYALPKDETNLSVEHAEAKKNLIRFKYGKQAILKGALAREQVPVLAYLKREDLEAALLQGTLVAEFDKQRHQVFNVHRVNNRPYDKTKTPYQQERYWYFKAVNGIKGYGKDAEHKITVNPEVTFAADLAQLGLGKLLMVQYHNKGGKTLTRAGILADTGGAFQNNLYQIDYLAGSYKGKDAFYQASRELPDYVAAYFMVLKN